MVELLRTGDGLLLRECWTLSHLVRACASFHLSAPLSRIQRSNRIAYVIARTAKTKNPQSESESLSSHYPYGHLSFPSRTAYTFRVAF